MGNLKILRSSMVQLLIDQCVLINQLEWEKKNQLEWLFFAEELACGSTVGQRLMEDNQLQLSTHDWQTKIMILSVSTSSPRML
jgi:hypothetical protein